MRSGAAAGHTGYFHETAFYASDDELLAIALPFLEDGRAAGEPTIVALDDAHTAAVVRALGRLDGITFLRSEGQYARPATTIARYRELLGGHVAAGASQIRVIGDVPHPGTGGDWPTWLRYEACVNEALEEFPLWGLCPYDTRTTPDDVLADVEHLHPHVATATGQHVRSERFSDPAAYAGRRLRDGAPRPNPTPWLSLDDVRSPRPVRAAVRAVATEAFVDPARVDDLVVSASEIVTNALLHGRPPVRVRLWGDHGSVVCEVRDGGDGPLDPFVGLRAPAAGSEGGYGVWMANQVCDRVDLDLGDDGFAVRLVIG